ncbi:MAG: transcriptional regulator, partial [Micrococcaceae bacterium]|nr:transcriptional regulator [Micrococcaceae bacterium]
MTPRMTARRLARELGEWRTGGPAYQALADRVRVLVLDGRVGVGTGLPAERELSLALDVSRTTVAAAYAQLRTDGYLLSVRGSGSTIALPGGHRGSPDPDPGAALDFTKAALPAYPGLAAAFTRAAERLPRYLEHPGFDLVGLPELRSALAQLYTDRGVATSPDQIMV